MTSEINPGDDITISGVVVDTENGNILVMLPNGAEMWIDVENVKTIRPHGKGGKG